MPKRKGESKEERWERKMKKYESKLRLEKERDRETPDYDNELPADEAASCADIWHVSVCDSYEYYRGTTPPCSSIAVPQEPLRDEVTVDTAAATASPTDVDVAPAAAVTDSATVVTDSATVVTDTAAAVDEPSTSALDIDPELFKALGDAESESVEWGDDIYDDIAKRFQPILINGLKKEVKEQILKKYFFPKNISFSKAPTLNPEISAMLTEGCRNRDKRIHSKQDQLGKALSALGTAMTALLKRNPDLPEALRMLTDAGKLISDSHFSETDTRRSLIIPLIDKSLIEPFKDRKRDSLLFGDKLSDLVKSSRGIKKTAQNIQASASTATGGSGLNWKGPSSRPRQQQGSQHRAGGRGSQYFQYAGRRRAQMPAPPARRQPAPPPPPPSPPARRQPPAHAAARRRPAPDRPMS